MNKLSRKEQLQISQKITSHFGQTENSEERPRIKMTTKETIFLENYSQTIRKRRNKNRTPSQILNDYYKRTEAKLHQDLRAN